MFLSQSLARHAVVSLGEIGHRESTIVTLVVSYIWNRVYSFLNINSYQSSSITKYCNLAWGHTYDLNSLGD